MRVESVQRDARSDQHIYLNFLFLNSGDEWMSLWITYVFVSLATHKMLPLLDSSVTEILILLKSLLTLIPCPGQSSILNGFSIT